ncbi:MAG: M15 family metallopeptidase [Bacteroidota bacterium]
MRGYTTLIVLLLLGCNEATKKKATPIEATSSMETPSIVAIDSVAPPPKRPALKSFEGLADTTFVRLADFSHDFVYDMRYATTNNFLKAKVYDCAECYTRVKTAKALIAANATFMEKGYRIKFFDCYRPNAVQHKMWALFPNPQYVANPHKGSIHNKGGAVDITLVDEEGRQLNMGTIFDFFGRRAHHDFVDLPQEVLDNRAYLKETMEKYGFWGIRTEWWHYNLSAGSNDKVANFRWPCPSAP